MSQEFADPTVHTSKPFASQLSDTDSPVEGVRVRINKKNKFLVFELHYSADPRKRDQEYRNSVKSSMPLANYLQEYELQWDTFIGTPVYRDFQEKVHVSQKKLYPETGLPLLRGWDFGLTPACIVAQLQGEQLVVLWEKQEFNMGIERFSEACLRELAIEFPEWSDPKQDWRDYADPSGAFRKDTDENTCFKVLHSKGLSVKGGAIDWETRRSSVEYFLLRQTRAGPGLLVDASCTHFIRGLRGGYRYPEKVAEVEPHTVRPIKDEHSHIQDAFQMITSKIASVNKPKTKRIPVPGYSLNGNSPSHALKRSNF